MRKNSLKLTLRPVTLQICSGETVVASDVTAVIEQLATDIQTIEAALSKSNVQHKLRKQSPQTLAIKTLEKSLLESYLAGNDSEKKTAAEALRALRAYVGDNGAASITLDKLLVFLLIMPSEHAEQANVFYNSMRYLCAEGKSVALSQGSATSLADSIKIDDACRLLFPEGLQLKKEDKHEHDCVAESQRFARLLWGKSLDDKAKIQLLAKWCNDRIATYNDVAQDLDLKKHHDICQAAGRVTLEANFEQMFLGESNSLLSKLPDVSNYREALCNSLRSAIDKNPHRVRSLRSSHEWKCLEALKDLCSTASVGDKPLNAQKRQVFEKFALTSPYQKLAWRALAAVLVCTGVCAVMACTGGAAVLAALGVNTVLIASGGVGVAAGLGTGILSLRPLSSSAGEKSLLLLSLVLLVAGLCVLMACTGGGAAALAALSAFVVKLSVVAPAAAIASGSVLTAVGVGVGLFSVKRKPHESSAVGAANAIRESEQYMEAAPAKREPHSDPFSGSCFLSDTAL
jgi:hypothetical protein